MLSLQFCDLSTLDAYQSDSAQRKLFLAGAVSAVALPDQAVEAVYGLQQYHIHVHSLLFSCAQRHDHEAQQSARRPHLSVKTDSAYLMR